MIIPTPHGPLFTKRWLPSTSPQARKATPIVLFHESLGCTALWRDFPQALAEASSREVISYDRLGYGLSAPHLGELSRRFISEEAKQSFAALRKSLRLRRYLLYGHSVGGAMAVACGAAYPKECVGVITEAAQSFNEEITRRGVREAGEHFSKPEQLARLAKYHGDKAGWVLRSWVETWLSAEYEDWSLDNELLQLHVPVLALHGDADHYGSVKQAERIVETCRGTAELAVLKDCGHFPHREQRTQILERIARWLGEVEKD